MIGTKNNENIVKEFGDYQTPIFFVDKIIDYIKYYLGITPSVILEPTFGIGNFITSCIKSFDSVNKVFGLEINKSYFEYAKTEIHKELKKRKTSVELELFHEDFFNFDFERIKNLVDKQDNLLIIGNPPWITNSELSSLGSSNLPLKDNFKGLMGLDAITGKGNFDIAEYIILQLLSEFNGYNCNVVMLCKNIIAKNIVRDLGLYNFKLSEIKFLNFDAERVFDVSCNAGILNLRLGNERKTICDCFNLDDPSKKIKSFGWVDGNFISNIERYMQDKVIDGTCQFIWRQGIKHDCSKVMELSKYNNDSYCNGFSEELDIEDDYVYPLLKSSDLKKYIITNTRKSVIVTQKKVKEDTERIKEKSPKLWDYLQRKSHYLDNRKSSIYKNSPRFSIFGIGEYSFMPYKVAVSGFYKEPIFALVYSKKPVMLDDTCYFIGNLYHLQN